jgi:hypothetical protein
MKDRNVKLNQRLEMLNLTNDYLGHIDYERNGYTDCSSHGCDDEGICRCYTITSIDINNIDLNSLALSIFSEVYNRDASAQRDRKITTIIHGYDLDEANKYCIHRILTINKLYKHENWEISWSGGYYGDELDGGHIVKPLYDKISSEIEQVLNFESLEDKINFVLNLEYGHVLSDLVNKKYEIITVPISDIIFGQKQHHDNVLIKDKRYYNYYPNDIPLGVCLLKNNKWRVIDGYHRFTNSKLSNVRIIGIK